MKRLSFILLICLSLLFPATSYADYFSYSSNNFILNPNIDVQATIKYYNKTFNSEQIKLLQKRLNELGYNCGIADGVAGNKTIMALMKFQEDKKLTINGIPDNTTLTSLGIKLDIPASNTNNTYTVKLKSSYMEYNNHVGNEWGTGVKVNGEELNWGDAVKISVTNNNPIKITVSAMEYDSIPDSASTTKSITAKELSNKNPLVYTISTTVVENRGRYSGNTAKWIFEFEITKGN